MTFFRYKHCTPLKFWILYLQLLDLHGYQILKKIDSLMVVIKHNPSGFLHKRSWFILAVKTYYWHQLPSTRVKRHTILRFRLKNAVSLL